MVKVTHLFQPIMQDMDVLVLVSSQKFNHNFSRSKN